MKVIQSVYISQYLRQFGGFFPVSSSHRTDHHDITDTLLKVALKTINQTITPSITSMTKYSSCKGDCTPISSTKHKGKKQIKFQCRSSISWLQCKPFPIPSTKYNKGKNKLSFNADPPSVGCSVSLLCISRHYLQERGKWIMNTVATCIILQPFDQYLTSKRRTICLVRFLDNYQLIKV